VIETAGHKRRAKPKRQSDRAGLANGALQDASRVTERTPFRKVLECACPLALFAYHSADRHFQSHKRGCGRLRQRLATGRVY